MKFDLVTLYPMHRRCITLISSLLNPSGWVRKPLNYLKVRTGMYRYILVRTNMEFLYCPVPSHTGTYWYVPVRTILPNPVQGYRIPDGKPLQLNPATRAQSQMKMLRRTPDDPIASDVLNPIASALIPCRTTVKPELNRV